ncbi:MAG TPA: right-handed parallel beta-helix repeat-containing protein [Myxococcota bacterium]|nr:right-handed parallel beta-helix repeat-containing protein [Myxococcota bacterium]HRY93647.1 right-handed parallel beta-helix repeat-containing protein [Myxococcota bacterium]HSA23102.1 right-handed parallel beta-helix repeat-containing protein [Myxococcota bacterium]
MSRLALALAAALLAAPAGAEAPAGEDAAWATLQAGAQPYSPPYGRPETPSPLQALIDGARDGATVVLPPGEHRGGCLFIEGRKGLTLKAEPGRTWLVSEDSLHDVLVIADSQDITLDGLGLLHEPAGHCTGDAIEIARSRRVTIRSCDLSGSGVAGVRAAYSADLVIERNHIHHCTYETVSLSWVLNAKVVDNLLRQNGESQTHMEGVGLSTVFGRVAIRGNTFADNPSTPITLDEYPTEPVPGLPAAEVLISRNLFVRSRSPAKRASVWLKPPDQGPAWTAAPGVRRLELRENCFDTSHKRKDLRAHVAVPAILTGNQVVPLELDPGLQVKNPSACSGRGARLIPWLGLSRDPGSGE